MKREGSLPICVFEQVLEKNAFALQNKILDHKVLIDHSIRDLQPTDLLNQRPINPEIHQVRGLNKMPSQILKIKKEVLRLDPTSPEYSNQVKIAEQLIIAAIGVLCPGTTLAVIDHIYGANIHGEQRTAEDVLTHALLRRVIARYFADEIIRLPR